MLEASGVLGSVELRGSRAGDRREGCASGEGTDAPGVTGGLALVGAGPELLSPANLAKRRLRI